MWKRVEEFDRAKWNEFVTKNGPESGRFLQSWEWGDVQGGQRKTGEDRGSQKWVANVFVKKLPIFGSYIYCPRGPIVGSEKQWSEIIKEILRFAQDDGQCVVFARFDIPFEHFDPSKNWVKTIDVSPSRTWITDLDKSEEELFAAIHKKTRYNIGLAQRNNLRVEIGSKDFEKVWPLFESTSTRGQFRLHNKSHYKKLLDVAFLAVVWKDNEPIAANIMIDFAEVRTYLHGASSHEYRALMAPHLLHWELIKDAKQKGFKKYDWWGIAPEDQPNHPWVGISRFKKSFPGREVVYVGTYDFVIKPFWYNLYRLARKVRRAI